MVAYRLELPSSSAIHPVFHVSQLKKAVGAHHAITIELPTESALWNFPERILQQRLLHKGTTSVVQGLIKWSQLPESLATWEELDFLRQQFPCAPVWGHAGAQGGGSVSTDPVHRQATEVTEGGKSLSEPSEEEGRKARPKTKSVRFHGPEWLNG